MIELEEKTDNSDDIVLNIEVCQGACLDALGDEALAEIQQKNPKAKIYEQKLGWLKEEWQACWKPNKNFAEKISKNMEKLNREGSWHIPRLADCERKLGQMQIGSTRSQLSERRTPCRDISRHGEIHRVNQASVKRDNRSNTDIFIKAWVEADWEYKKLHKRPPSTQEVKVKDEPVA